MNKLKYFFEYINTVNDFYRFEINQVGFTGNAIEINGRAVINKASIKDHIDPFRGTSITVTLEASEELTLSDLISETEFDFPVTLYKNGSVYFKGYLNPDGAFQSYTRSNWQITLECIDGLGALENLSFVDDYGVPFVGKIKPIDIIYYCLKRTRTDQKINIDISIEEESYIPAIGETILNKIYVDTSRYVKDDGDTIMGCGEVLKSILNIFSAVITQRNGEWYIYRSSDFSLKGYGVFTKYDTNNVFEKMENLTSNIEIGSHINNFYPHHCSGDQSLQVKGASSAYRINYKYGFLKSIIPNNELLHDASLNYDNWNVNPAIRPYLINDPNRLSGIIIVPDSATIPDVIQVAESEASSISKDNAFRFSTSLNMNGACSFTYTVTIESLEGIYYLAQTGEWTLTPIGMYFEVTKEEFDRESVDMNSYIDDFGHWNTAPKGFYFDFTDRQLKRSTINKTFSVESVITPVEGLLRVYIYRPYSAPDPENLQADRVIINNVNVINNTTSELKGEFHTIQRRGKVSSNVKENLEVSNGDSASSTFDGAIYKNDKITLTENWTRTGYNEKKPLLRIAVEDALRMSQKPMQTFYGSFYGYIPYLSNITINNLSGKFLPIEYSYDTFINIGTAKWMQIYTDELQDIDYSITYDTGKTVKPTILE